jgi:exopolyphosphatase/guanosine-5'-triphosphate,3'-diphosphate pyrophosphatase
MSPVPSWLHAAALRPDEEVLSLIDLGTNSIRLDLVALRRGQARRLHREKRMVRLGDGLFAGGRLNRAALERVEAALADFAALHRAAGVRRVLAVATAALREAPEAPRLVEAWKERFGIAFRVISGLEEAALIARGVLAQEAPPSGPYALIDIGGGSTELSLCRGSTVLESVSLPLGASRLQQTCLQTLPPVPGGVEALRAACRRPLENLRDAGRWPRVREFIGSGGSIRALRKLARAAEAKAQPFTLHFLTELNRRLIRLDRVGLLHVPGMDPKRVDLLVAGSLLLEECCLVLGAQRIRSTDAGLRDGLLLEAGAAP